RTAEPAQQRGSTPDAIARIGTGVTGALAAWHNLVGRPSIFLMDADDIAAGRARWQRRYDTAGKREADFGTLSGLEVDPVYGPAPGDAVGGFERIGWPGEFPFTRGLYPAGYRGRTWTIRQFAGFGNARQTNERYKLILAAGGGGLSVAFDMPTLMGRD